MSGTVPVLEVNGLESKNLWAPWRIKYIQALEQDKECFICVNHKRPERDKENMLLWRTEHCLVMFNAFPYNNGHLLICPIRHIPDLAEAADGELLEMMKLIDQCQKVLTLAINPHGFNVGINLGRCAGAGLPGHMHIHVVPRWDGDTNFMAVCSDTDVISQSIHDLHEKLLAISSEKNLPNV